jgi:hypothetical protein
MDGLIPLWIIGGPVVGLLILAFSFNGPSAMGGSSPRWPRERDLPPDPSAPLLDPMHPDAPRRLV